MRRVQMSSSRAVGLCLISIFVAGCADEESLGKAQHALSHAGPWDIPSSTLAIGDTEYVPYTGAGPWTGTSACSGGITAGAEVFRGWLREAFPQIASIGGYSCRPIVGNESQMSVHATGRALDVMIPTDGGAADNDAGDPIGNWLIEHAEEIGIQYIIWDRWTWNASRAAGSKERMYGGTNPHVDHLHVELSLDASAMRTPWFTGPRTLPSTAGCDAVPTGGGEVRETAPCFSSFGPSAYWRRVSDAGYGGSLLWTNAFQNDTPSNWARWRIDMTTGGTYTVEAYVDPLWGVHRATRYRVRAGGSETDVIVDQSASDGWASLGEHDFATGGDQWVSVYDNVAGAIAADQHIAVDAIRLRPEAEPPPPDTDPTPDPEMPDPSMEPPPRVTDPIDMPIVGGDPTIDDDPLPTGIGLESGCSAAGPGRGTSSTLFAWAAAVVAVAFGARRRRRGPGARETVTRRATPRAGERHAARGSARAPARTSLRPRRASRPS